MCFSNPNDAWAHHPKNRSFVQMPALLSGYQRGPPALHLNEPAGGSCCDAGLGFVWHCYCIDMTFVCLIQKKWIYFELLRGRGCVESKNMTSAKRKSTMSSLNPSIIQVGSFKCRADVPLRRDVYSQLFTCGFLIAVKNV